MLLYTRVALLQETLEHIYMHIHIYFWSDNLCGTLGLLDRKEFVKQNLPMGIRNRLVREICGICIHILHLKLCLTKLSSILKVFMAMGLQCWLLDFGYLHSLIVRNMKSSCTYYA